VTSTPRRRPGRPPAEESVGRTDEIIAAARRNFGTKGFDATTLSGVAGDAGLSLAALYHYVDDKFQLYELVFRSTLTEVWGGFAKRLAGLEPSVRLADRFEALLGVITSDHRGLEVDAFLASAPVEFRRHPELAHLAEERDRVRLEVLTSMVEPVFLDGTFARFGDIEHATRALEVLFSGWSLESFYRPEQRAALTRALLDLATMLDREPVIRQRTTAKQPSKRGHIKSA
jgi:AcrR family transcriptional regulator